MWPILIAKNITPVVVAIWYGENKPASIDDYLGDFLKKLNYYRINGLTINGHHIMIDLKSFV